MHRTLPRSLLLWALAYPPLLGAGFLATSAGARTRQSVWIVPPTGPHQLVITAWHGGAPPRLAIAYYRQATRGMVGDINVWAPRWLVVSGLLVMVGTIVVVGTRPQR